MAVKQLKILNKWADLLIQKYYLEVKDRLDKKLDFFKDLVRIMNIKADLVICMNNSKITKIKNNKKCRKKRSQYKKKDENYFIFFNYKIFSIYCH